MKFISLSFFSCEIDNRPFGSNTFLGFLAPLIQSNSLVSYGITVFGGGGGKEGSWKSNYVFLTLMLYRSVLYFFLMIINGENVRRMIHYLVILIIYCRVSHFINPHLLYK